MTAWWCGLSVRSVGACRMVVRSVQHNVFKCNNVITRYISPTHHVCRMTLYECVHGSCVHGYTTNYTYIMQCVVRQ